MTKIDGMDVKPCPFCGADAEYEDFGGLGPFYLSCANVKCQAEGPVRKGVPDAIEKWNSRVAAKEQDDVQGE